jgi:glycosyltransferase involved in cell wall biosynthesis
MEKMDVTVIVPMHDGAPILPTFLTHLELQSHPAARFEVLIVDMGSTDGTSEVVRRYADGAPMRTRCLLYGSTQAGEALTAAALAAEGRWLLFLHQDVLAGPHLIRAHVRAQEQHGGDVVVRGKIDFHPQLPMAGADSPLVVDEPRAADGDGTIPYRQWRLWNLSISKASVQGLEGFRAAFPFPDYADVDLASRLHQQGKQGYYAAEAAAYLWYVPDFDEERRRAFARGYCRQVLLEGDEDLGQLVHLEPRCWLPALGVPVFRVLAGKRHGTRGLRGFAQRHVLRQAMASGSRAAAAGRPATLPR